MPKASASSSSSAASSRGSDNDDVEELCSSSSSSESSMDSRPKRRRRRGRYTQDPDSTDCLPPWKKRIGSGLHAKGRSRAAGTASTTPDGLAALSSIDQVVRRATLYSDMIKEEIDNVIAPSAALAAAIPPTTNPAGSSIASFGGAEDLSSLVSLDLPSSGGVGGSSSGDLGGSSSLLEGGTLMPHQRYGVAWLLSLYANGLNGILADEMGLGKTVQIIGLIAALTERGVVAPHLIVAPLSTLENWRREFETWAPRIPVMVYHGAQGSRNATRTILRRKSKRIALAEAAAKRAEAEGDGVDDEAVLMDVPIAQLAAEKKRRRDHSVDVDRALAWKGGVVLTTYDTIMSDSSVLRSDKYKWCVLVVDEAHRLKNFECRLIQCLRSFRAEARVLLTGTPLQNRLSELWSILNFVVPEVFDSRTNFEDWFELQLFHDEVPNDDDGGGGAEEEVAGNQAPTAEPTANGPPVAAPATTDRSSPAFLHTLQQARLIMTMHRVLRPFMLRRTKESIPSLGLPKKIELIMLCPMSAEQRRIYDIVRQEPRYACNRYMHLRKVCNHPHLFDRFDPFDAIIRTNGGYTHWPDQPDVERRYLEAFMAASAKFQLLERVLPRLRRAGHRVLLFSQFTATLDLVEDYLNHVRRREEREGAVSTPSHVTTGNDVPPLPSLAWVRLDGRSTHAERFDSIRKFSTQHATPMKEAAGPTSSSAAAADQPSPSSSSSMTAPFLFLISTRAGGLGLNLAAADTVILFDGDFNPYCDLQAIDRCHRIGQKQDVVVLRFVCPATVEETVLEFNMRKLRLENLVIQRGQLHHGSTSNASTSGLSPTTTTAPPESLTSSSECDDAQRLLEQEAELVTAVEEAIRGGQLGALASAHGLHKWRTMGGGTTAASTDAMTTTWVLGSPDVGVDDAALDRVCGGSRSELPRWAEAFSK